MFHRSNSSLMKTSAGAVFVALGGVASAQTSAPISAPISSPGTSPHLQEAVSTQLIATTSVTQMLTISNAISARRFARQLGPTGRISDSTERYGLAAGNAPANLNVWASLARDNTEYTGISRFDMEALNRVYGLDFAVTPNATLGVSLVSDGASGLIGTGNPYSASGSSIAPYFGYQINKELALDGTMGWGSADVNDNAGRSHAERSFYGANLSYVNWSGNLQISGKGNFLHGEEKYSLTTNKVDQWRIGSQVAYWNSGFMPYAGVTYANDSRSISNPRVGSTDAPGTSAWLWSLGLNYMSLQNGLTAGFVYNVESGRSDSSASNWALNVNYRF